jgi:hypothetical protein
MRIDLTGFCALVREVLAASSSAAAHEKIADSVFGKGYPSAGVLKPHPPVAREGKPAADEFLKRHPDGNPGWDRLLVTVVKTVVALLRIPGDGDQRSEVMSITIPK